MIAKLACMQYSSSGKSSFWRPSSFQRFSAELDR